MARENMMVHKGISIKTYVSPKKRDLCALAAEAFPKAQYIEMCFDRPRIRIYFHPKYEDYKVVDYPDFPLAQTAKFIKSAKKLKYYLLNSYSNIYIKRGSISIYFTPHVSQRAKISKVRDNRYHGRKIKIGMAEFDEDGEIYEVIHDARILGYYVNNNTFRIMLKGNGISLNRDQFEYVSEG